MKFQKILFLFFLLFTTNILSNSPSKEDLFSKGQEAQEKQKRSQKSSQKSSQRKEGKEKKERGRKQGVKIKMRTEIRKKIQMISSQQIRRTIQIIKEDSQKTSPSKSATF